jgi:uncharacterized membrane protein YoaK (UPF0700 family)
MKTHAVPGLLSFNGGCVDTAGFLGLQGLFTAHVTGNFVTLGAALVFGTHGCATAAFLYDWFGFWCLVVPVAVGAATAILGDAEGGNANAQGVPQPVARGP